MSDNNEWDAIDGFEGWAARLEQLLAEAEAAVKTDDIDRRVEVQRKLRQFRHHSPNTYCQKLDAIALQAIEDIFRATFMESLQAISQRSDELNQYVKHIRAVTEHAQRSASLINFSTPEAAVLTLTELVNSIRHVKTLNFAADDAEEISKRVDRVVAAIHKLRSVLERA